MMSVTSRSLSDSFDFASLPHNSGGSPGGLGWLDQISRPDGTAAESEARRRGSGPTPTTSPPVPSAVPAGPGRKRRLSAQSTRRVSTGNSSRTGQRPQSARPTQRSLYADSDFTDRSPKTPSCGTGPPGDGMGSTQINMSSALTSGQEGTPAAQGYFGDLTVVGSPIPVETDDSDAAMRALVAHLQSAEGELQSTPNAEDELGDDARPLGAAPLPYPLNGERSLVSPRQEMSSSYASALIQALSRSEGTAMRASNGESFATTPNYHSSSDSDGPTRANDLYDHAMRVKVAKQQWLTMERVRQELLTQARIERDCPFKPTISPYAARLRRPPQLRPEHRVRGEQLRKKQWTAMKRQEEVERELEACTFRPLTLRSARQHSQSREPRHQREVFNELYQEAQARDHFEHSVQPQIVDVVERHVLNRNGGRVVLTAEEAKRAVERLCARGTLVSAARTLAAEREGVVGTTETPFVPQLSEQTRRIVARQQQRGERHPDVIEDLYSRREAALMEREVNEALQQEKDEANRRALVAKREQAREGLELERFRTVLAAKFQVLAKHSWLATHTREPLRGVQAHSIVGLARAALDLLSSEETEVILAAFERCGLERVTEEEFVFLLFSHVTAEDKTASAWRQNALFTEPPPPPESAVAKRSSSQGTVEQPLPRIRREKPDPKALERARQRRETLMLQWREEARQRAEEKEMGDPNYRPPQRHLIPYECRPDVQVPTRTNRAAQLREAHVRTTTTTAEGEPVAPAPVRLLPGSAPAAHTPAGAKPTARTLFSTTPPTGPLGGASQPAAPPPTHARPVAGAQASPSPVPRAASHPHAPIPARSPTGTSNAAASPPVERSPRATGALPSSPRSVATAQRGAVQPTVRGSPPPTRVAQPKPQSSVVAESAQLVTAPRGAVVPSDHLYQAVIAEHAAFGGEEALMELGRELLLRQLREYRAQQRANTD